MASRRTGSSNIPRGESRHIENYDNPHKVSASQIGAYTRDEIDRLLTQIDGGERPSNRSGIFKGNVVAYSEGDGTSFSARDYTVNQLGLNQLVFRPVGTGRDVFIQENGEWKIDSFFLSDDVTASGEWLDILNNPFNGFTPSSFLSSSATAQIEGTSNQVIVSNETSQDFNSNPYWKLSLPQNIHTGANVVFNTVQTVGNITAYKDGGGNSLQDNSYEATNIRVDQLRYNDSGTVTDVFVNGLINPQLITGGSSLSLDWENIDNKPFNSFNPSQFDLGGANNDVISLKSNMIYDSNFTVTGNLYVQGQTVEIDSQITTSDAVIDVNDGEQSGGVTLGYAGLNIDRGSSNNYWFGFDETRDRFTVGKISSLSSAQIALTQVVATREDSPESGGIFYWDDSNKRLKNTTNAKINDSGEFTKGSITDTFGSIDIGSSSLDAGAGTFTTVHSNGNITSNSNILAYNNGSGTSVANQSYTVDQLTINQIVKDSTSFFEVDGKINTAFLPASSLSDSVLWANIDNNPFASNVPSDFASSSNLSNNYYDKTTSDSRFLRKVGGTMTGNIEFTDDGEGIEWNRNTDGASIKFYNDSDSDSNSRLEFHVEDNGNEFFRWTRRDGSTTYEDMKLKGGNLSVLGNVTGDNLNISNWDSAYTHISANNNPHSVTKSQVGLGSVENIALSAWEGTSNITTVGAVTATSLDIGTTGHGFDSSGNVSALYAEITKDASLDGSSPSKMRISNSFSSGSWTDGAKVASLEYYSEDTSGNGAGVKARTSITAETSISSIYKYLIEVDNFGESSGLIDALSIDRFANIDVINGSLRIGGSDAINSDKNAFISSLGIDGDISWDQDDTLSEFKNNIIYAHNELNNVGFAFGLGNSVSTWFVWDGSANRRSIDVANDGSKIDLGLDLSEINLLQATNVSGDLTAEANINAVGTISSESNIIAYSNGGGSSIQDENYTVSTLTFSNLTKTGTNAGSFFNVNGIINDAYLPATSLSDNVEWVNILNNPFENTTPSAFASASHTHGFTDLPFNSSTYMPKTGGTFSGDITVDVDVNNAGDFPVGGSDNNGGIKITNNSSTTDTYSSVMLRSYTGDAHLYASTTGTSNQVNFGIWLDDSTSANRGTRFFINGQSGNVGIGTTSPSEKTHIFGSNPFLKLGHDVNDGGAIGIKFNHYRSTQSRNKTAIVSDSVGSWGRADLHFIADTNGDNNEYTLGTDTKLFIDGLTGQVGINRTNPSYQFDVSGTGRFDTVLANGAINSTSSASLQVNGFMRTGQIYLHEGGNDPNGNANTLGNVNGNLEWRGNPVYHSGNKPSASDVGLGNVWNADVRDYGIGQTGTNNITELSQQNLEGGLYSSPTSATGSAMSGSSGAFINVRTAVSGGAVSQLWMLGNNVMDNRAFIRHCDSNGVFTGWDELYHTGNLTDNDQLSNGAGYYSSGSNPNFNTGNFSGLVTIKNNNVRNFLLLDRTGDSNVTEKIGLTPSWSSTHNSLLFYRSSDNLNAFQVGWDKSNDDTYVNVYGDLQINGNTAIDSNRNATFNSGQIGSSGDAYKNLHFESELSALPVDDSKNYIFTTLSGSDFFSNFGALGIASRNTDTDSSKIGFFTGGTLSAFFDKAGSLGIGVANQDTIPYTLDVNGTGRFSGELNIGSFGDNTGRIRSLTNSGGSPAFEFSDNYADLVWAVGLDDRGSTGSGDNAFVIRYNSGTAFSDGWTGNGTEYFTLDGNGNLGLSDTSPSYRLDVNGTGRFTGNLYSDSALYTENIYPSDGSQIGRASGGSPRFRFYTDEIDTTGTGDLVWNAGNVGIGISPTSKLHIQNFSSGETGAYNSNSLVRIENNTDAFIEIKSPNSSYSGIVFTDNTAQAGGIAYAHNGVTEGNTLGIGGWTGISFRVQATAGVFEKTERMYIDSSGDVSIGSSITFDSSAGVSKANDHEDSSDIRIKSNIIPVNPLEIASFASLKKYNKEGLDKPQYGLIAQDMMRFDNDIAGTMSHDKYGEIFTLSGYSIGSIALAGVGELDKKFEVQKSETDILKEKVAQLEQKVEQLGGVV